MGMKVTNETLLNGDNFTHKGVTYRAKLGVAKGGKFIAKRIDNRGRMVGDWVEFSLPSK